VSVVLFYHDIGCFNHYVFPKSTSKCLRTSSEQINISFRIWYCFCFVCRAKRYPIRLESKNSVLYNGSKTCYIYSETSWEKESWCKALRLASCPDRAKL